MKKRRNYRKQFNMARRSLLLLGICMIVLGVGMYVYYIAPLSKGPYKGLSIVIFGLGIYTIISAWNWKFSNSLWGKRAKKSIKITRY